jgi:drug/metabolite transporter (DMT)-like permease
VTAVGLAIVSAALFGAMTVLVRIGLRRAPEADLATLATILPALAVSLVAAAVAGGGGGGVGRAWPFALAGLLAPGGSQILFTFAIRAVGASRTSVVVGGAPLVAVAIALIALHEPVSPPLLVGAVLIVAGGAALVSEPGRPEHLRAIGLGLAAAAAALFATRDNLVRWLADADASAPTVAAAATLLSGVVVAALYARRLPSLRTQLAFLPAGICFGLSYVALFEAYYRGRVTVVSPLVATETLWGVGLSALLLRQSELVGRRLLVGAALIVAGGALIGVFR